MKIVSGQKSKVLAENNGWSVDFAEGFLKGEYSRRNSARLSPYAMVGLDDYCLGLRAGYFERKNSLPARTQPQAVQQRAAYSERASTVAGSTLATTFKQGFAH